MTEMNALARDAPDRAVATPVLMVEDLEVHYDTPEGPAKAVNKVSFALRPGERLGLIGESGSGKTTMAMALMRLTRPPARIAGGRVSLDGRDLLAMGEAELRQTRLPDIALVPQGAMSSLNPVMPVGEQIGEVQRLPQVPAQREEQREDAVRVAGPEGTEPYQHVVLRRRQFPQWAGWRFDVRPAQPPGAFDNRAEDRVEVGAGPAQGGEYLVGRHQLLAGLFEIMTEARYSVARLPRVSVRSHGALPAPREWCALSSVCASPIAADNGRSASPLAGCADHWPAPS